MRWISAAVDAVADATSCDSHADDAATAKDDAVTVKDDVATAEDDEEIEKDAANATCDESWAYANSAHRDRYSPDDGNSVNATNSTDEEGRNFATAGEVVGLEELVRASNMVYVRELGNEARTVNRTRSPSEPPVVVHSHRLRSVAADTIAAVSRTKKVDYWALT